MAWPQFLALCGLLPFLLVSILHLLYASRCWSAYVRSGAWAGMLALNVLVLAPYANVLAFPALLVWLLIATTRAVRKGCGDETMLAAAAAPPRAVYRADNNGSVSLSLSKSDTLPLASLESQSAHAASLGFSTDATPAAAVSLSLDSVR